MAEGSRLEGKAQPQSTSAVLVAEGRNKTMNILVAVDDSEESFYALRWLLDKFLTHTIGSSGTAEVAEQEAHNNLLITAIHVMAPSPRYAFPGGQVETGSTLQEQNAARILSRAYEMCKEKKVKASTLVLEGDPKDRICQTVDEMKIDLVVVGSHGLGQIKRAFLGSVSDYCAHHAKCPVLIVKRPKGTS